MTDNHRTALITGASAGIGAEFAKVFAEHFYNLVLVARREDRLNELADEIRSKNGVEVTVIAQDLGQPGSSEQLLTRLEEKGIQIDALINNAGYGIKAGFSETSLSQHLEMQQLMLTGYLELSHKLLPGMKDRGFGRIINVSSVAGLTPSMKGSLYNAIKSWVIQMTVAMDFEVRDAGVHCTVICPGFTPTEFAEVMGIEEQTASVPNFLKQTPRAVAEEGYTAVMEGKVVKVNGLHNRILVGIINLMPIELQLWIARRQTMFED